MADDLFTHRPDCEVSQLSDARDAHVKGSGHANPVRAAAGRWGGRKCAECGRQGQYGIAELERQIDRSGDRLTFFSTETERGQGGFDLFVTEPLLELLRQAGMKGATFRRLLDAEEEPQVQEKRKKQQSWRPTGSVVVL